MDDLRLALLIAGVVIVAGIYALTLRSRRKSAKREEESDLVARGPSDDTEFHDDSASLDPRPTGDGAGTDADVDVDDLGGVFTARRETSDAELSVDVSILAGLRATWESTVDGTIEDSVPSAHFAPSADPGDRDPLAVDMSRPLVYLTLVSRQERLSGRVILDALDDEGFRPGMMQLYYWRSDEEPSVTFGVANMLEPGVLEPDSLLETETPGLVAFMSVPEDGARAFRILDTMIANSRRLARRLDATLCDDTRSTLTAQAENHLREKVAEILRRDLT